MNAMPGETLMVGWIAFALLQGTLVLTCTWIFWRVAKRHSAAARHLVDCGGRPAGIRRPCVVSRPVAGWPGMGFG